MSMYPRLPANAAKIITIGSDVTTVNVEDMDSHSEGVVPVASMAIRADQWFEYKIESPVKGDFTFTLHYHYRTTWSLKITLNGEVAYSGTFTEQGNYGDIYYYTELCTLHLKKGVNTIKLERISKDYHIKCFVLKSVTPLFDDNLSKSGAYRNVYLPAIVQAEDFDYVAGVGYRPIGTKRSNSYREDCTIKINDLSNNKYSIVLGRDDWASYTVNVEYPGVYLLKASTTSFGTMEFYINESLVAEAELSGDGQYKEFDAFSIYLPKGVYKFRAKSVKGDMDVDYFRFASSASDNFIQIGQKVDNNENQDNAQNTQKSVRPVYKELYVAPTGDDSNTGEKDSPYRTIKRAKQEVAAIRKGMSGDIIVNIAPGYYQLEETEVFDNSQSGENGFNVVYKGNQSGEKPVIGGGVRVSGWEKENDNIYKAHLPEVTDMRNFYVNGSLVQRARSKYGYSLDKLYQMEGSAYSSDGFTISKRNFPGNLSNVRDIELSWTNEWTNNRSPVDEIIDDGDFFIFRMRQPLWEIGTTRLAVTRIGDGLFYIENARELLDEPGEFYFDKNSRTLYYYPKKDEELQTADCYVGQVDCLINIEGGSINNKAENIVFDGIAFRYGEWTYPNTYGILARQAGTMYKTETEEDITTAATYEMPSQFRINKAKNIQVKNCSFECLGSTAIGINNAATGIQIYGNIIKDVMGGGISVGNIEHLNDMPEGQEMCSKIVIRNNVIRRIGQGYFGLTGICAYYANTVDISNNDVADTPYTGISAGWGWGMDVQNCKNFTISCNKIYNTMHVLHDGAPIYTLGPIRGTKIFGNYLEKSDRGAAGIYHDNGSRYLETYNNVIVDCNKLAYLGTGGGGLLLHDNYTTTGEYWDATTGSSITNTVVVSDGKWPDAALDIMENAGVEQEYKGLLNDAALPEGRVLLSIPKEIFLSKSSVTVWAADYMPGGQGKAYYDTTPGNNGGAYRKDDVEIYASSTISGRYDVGIDVGEWIKWKTEIPETGLYNLLLWTANSRSASPPMPEFNMYINEQLMVKNHAVVYTGYTNIYKYTVVEDLYIEKGKKEIKIEGLNAFFGITYFRFEKKTDSYCDSDYDEGIIVLEKEKRVIKDIQSHWARDEIEYAMEKGIANGTAEDAFSPDTDITLQQAVLMLLRMLDLYDDTYTWQANAFETGLVDSADTEDHVITREEFIDVVMRAYLLRNSGYTLVYNLKLFNDLSEADSALINPILGAQYLGFIQGDENGSLNPKGKVTRAEAVVIINRFEKL